MIVRGLAGAGGKAAGRAWVWRPPQPRAPTAVAGEGAIEQYRRAQAAVERALDDRRRDLEGAGVSAEWLALLEAHRHMVRDPMLDDRVLALLAEGEPAAQAVWQAARAIRERFVASGSSYLADRAADVDQVRDRLLVALGGEGVAPPPGPDRPVVVVAADLPAELLLGWTPRVRAVCLDGGGPLSHVVIAARHLGIPTVCGLTGLSSRLEDGVGLLVDGDNGELIVAPDRAALRAWRQPAARAPAPGGLRLTLLANLATPEEDPGEADGVGLLRTEALAGCDEDEQARRYAALVQRMAPRPVTIRLFDRLPPRPAGPLGVRGARLFAVEPELMRAQLRAVARAGAQVMIPMVTTPDEVLAARAAARSASLAVGRPEQLLRVGVLVETPAAALQAQALARVADFLAVGTNDLLQFLVAADRRDPGLAHLLTWDHPVLLQLLRTVARAAREAGIPAWVCGELPTRDAGLACVVEAGFTAVSVNPRRLAELRRRSGKSAPAASRVLDTRRSFP